MKYTGFVELRKTHCGASFLKYFAKDMIDISVVDRNNKKMAGRLMYKVQGKRGFFHKDAKGNSDMSAAVIQFSKNVRFYLEPYFLSPTHSVMQIFINFYFLSLYYHYIGCT